MVVGVGIVKFLDVDENNISIVFSGNGISFGMIGINSNLVFNSIFFGGVSDIW